MDLAIRNEEKRLEDWENKKNKLEQEILLEKQLTVSAPKVLGAAAVLPMHAIKPDVEIPGVAGMARDDEIEQVGMDVTMAYENENGWTPEDVSSENVGFDIRSTKYSEDGTFEDIRYIEVKGRAQDGAIRLSANEWKKAKRFQDKYWLYVVTFAGTDTPKLRRYQNHATTFIQEEDIYATGYIIPKDSLSKVNE